MIKRLNENYVLIYLTHERVVHFSVLRLQRKNKHSTYFKTYFVSFRENGLFDMKNILNEIICSVISIL